MLTSPPISADSGSIPPIRDFFSLIPPEKWARVDGRPIVFLYGANFAKAQDPEALAYVTRAFQEDFGCGLYLVKMRDWLGEADAIYQWTGFSGLQMDAKVAAVSPGYDHSAVPGRTPIVVKRCDGRKYIDRWLHLLRLNPARRPWMVHVETWNEWHEGTDVAESREYGRSYIVPHPPILRPLAQPRPPPALRTLCRGGHGGLARE